MRTIYKDVKRGLVNTSVYPVASDTQTRSGWGLRWMAGKENRRQTGVKWLVVHKKIPGTGDRNRECLIIGCAIQRG